MDAPALVPEVVDPYADDGRESFSAYEKLTQAKTNVAVAQQGDESRLGRVDGLNVYDIYALIEEGVEPDLDDETIADFLNAYALTGQVPKAAGVVGVWPPAVYLLARRNPEFAKALQAARQIALNLAEDELFRRGFEGVEEDIFFQGMVVGQKRNYDTTALLRVLEAERPDKWKKRIANEHTGENGAPIAIDDARSAITKRVVAALGDAASGDNRQPDSD